MPVNLSGIIFSQVYTDNTGGPGAEFDSDGDGVATQEDEFVAVANLSGGAVDISGWQIWSDSAGSGAPDTPVDGLYHTFAPGTVIADGAALTVINEISAGGSVPFNAVEASEGGVESGAGGVSTNLLTEGDAGGTSEAIVLLNPATGEYIVFNYGPSPFNPSSIPGFPGTTNVGEVDAETVQADPGTGFAVQYDPVTDDYVLDTVFVPCFTPGTQITVPGGQRAVEALEVGDLVLTRDGRPEPVRAVLSYDLDLTEPAHAEQRPIRLNAGCFGSNLPARPLLVSPQHRVLMEDAQGNLVLVPAKALVGRPGIRVARGKRHVRYIQLVCASHVVVASEALWTESFYPGRYALLACPAKSMALLHRIYPQLRHGVLPHPAYPMLSVSEAVRQELHPPKTAVLQWKPQAS